MRPHFDTEARIAVAQATDIARELGHREVGPGHLLAALLANPRGTAYAALRDRGLDYDTARDAVAEHHVDVEPEPDRPAGADEGIHEDTDYADDRQALATIGIDLDRVREAVRANLGDDLADGWGERRGRRRDHHGHHDHQGQGQGRSRGRGRGRRGPRSRRDGLRFSRGLRAVLRDARHGAGLTGTGLLEALDRSDDPATRAVLATALQ